MTFSLVTSRDFGRSNAWAKRQPNELTQKIMHALLPKDIGGYQHLEPWVMVGPLDITVTEGKPVGFVGQRAKGTVAFAEAVTGLRVYRKIPVPSNVKGPA